MASIEYLAGFIDGDGSLSLAKRFPRWRSYEYSLRVVLYNTNREVLAEIRQTFGGVLTDVGPRSAAWKPRYALIWTNATAATLLSTVGFHLRVKRRQATTLLEFQEHLRECHRARDPRGRLLPLSGRELELREALYGHLKTLNAKGVNSPILPRSTGAVCEPQPRKRRDLSARYLAGFIDAEGCLMITQSKDPRVWRQQFRARISIGNTDRNVLEDIRQAYGGILVNQPPAKVGWKHAYQLIWSDGMVERLLSFVAPYLRVKREQATVMVAFIRHRKSTRQGRKRGCFASLPDEVLAFREGLHRRMKELNTRGPSPTARLVLQERQVRRPEIAADFQGKGARPQARAPAGEPLMLRPSPAPGIIPRASDLRVPGSYGIGPNRSIPTPADG